MNRVSRMMAPALRHPFWIGPALILAIWWLAAAGQWISPKLLPTPAATLQALSGSIADGSILADFAGTLKRTLGAFALAAAQGLQPAVQAAWLGLKAQTPADLAALFGWPRSRRLPPAK